MSVRFSISSPAPVAFWPKSGVVASSAIASTAAPREPVEIRAIQPVKPRQTAASRALSAKALAGRWPVRSCPTDTRKGKR